VFHVKHDPGIASRLHTYADLIRAWNPRLNLVSRTDLDSLEGRHIADSLQLAELIPEAVDRAIDLGSGAGFPGLILAIATGIAFTLIESDRRKAAFLLEAARRTRAPATIVAQRAEACHGLTASLVTARALAPLPRLLTLAAPFVAPGGCLLLPKGANAAAELTAATADWNMRVERFPSATAPGAVILRITDLAPRQR
jgi:16S rRNA (guanine527-N7)-methyltransferase